MTLQSSEWFSRNGIECSRIKASQSCFPKHTHDEYVISANLSGTEEIWLSGKVSTVKRGQVTLYNPGSIQSSRFGNESVEFISVHLSQSLLKSVAEEGNLSSQHGAPILYEGVFDNSILFNAIGRYAVSARHSDSDAQEQELIRLCGELIDSPIMPEGDEEQAIKRAVEYLREHLNIRPKLEVLAGISGLSKYHFVRRFTQYMGMPPLQYHMQLRLLRARHLLRNNVHPIDAANALGFYDQSHFINSFRKMMGTTPQHYSSQVGSFVAVSGCNKFSIP
ncbi:AraC family transcriptional regulator [Rouxiella sp. WC2420]|uniref:AraC family transcriptional regulator n=1 Tax=Rouxiella sp. WC2420 TaxID=3234145 RepID=A0AB39VWU6_9GAMM